MKLRSIWRQTNALLLLFPLMLLTGCVRTQTEYEAVKIPSLPLPESLLADCRIPDIPDEMTYADSVVLNLLMQGALEDCSNQLRAIKKLDTAKAIP